MEIKAYIKLKPNEEVNILKGFPWIYKNEVKEIGGEISSGGIVKVYDSNSKFVGIGYINLASKIIVRMLTLDDCEINQAFITNRVLQAVCLRKDLGIYDACRLIFSEGDLLPGVIVDKFNDYLVIEIATYGAERLKELIINALVDIVKPLGIYERSDGQNRKKEGLEPHIGFIGDEFDPNIIIEEHGLKVEVDILNGQKTGYFFDQRNNRELISKYVKGKKVLDCCTHTGSFSMHALKYDAESVTAVDISNTALLQTKKNLMLNNMEATLVESDAFMYLDSIEKGTFDVIILDPPAFIKNTQSFDSGCAGYAKLNAKALSKLNQGGILITFSCSGLLKAEDFLEVLNVASKKSGASTQLLDFRLQAEDHPMLLERLEKMYLKCAVLRVVK